jgi:hypothetical protein
VDALQGLIFALLFATLFPVLIFGYTRLKPRPVASDFGGEPIAFEAAMPRDEAMEALTNGWAIERSAVAVVDTTRGTVLARDGLSFTSLGYYYLVQVDATPGRQSRVVVRIKSKMVERGPLRRRARETRHREFSDGLMRALETFRLSRMAEVAVRELAGRK